MRVCAEQAGPARDLPDTLTTRLVGIRMRKHPLTVRLEPYLRRKVVDLVYVIEPLARVAVIRSFVGWDPEAGQGSRTRSGVVLEGPGCEPPRLPRECRG